MSDDSLINQVLNPLDEDKLAAMDAGGRHAEPSRHASPDVVPRLALDDLLAQLVEHADDIQLAHQRLRGLVAANRMIIGDLNLPAVLHRIVSAACQLVGARYGALGVISPTGDSLQSFITVGLDEEESADIGDLPKGRGLLGALIDNPRPIRLACLGDDSRSAGFPVNHPPMSSFLGVPIAVRDEVFGNLYLTESTRGEFSADDEEVALSLAATAGVAIENARLFEQAERRQRWLQASVEITTQLLSSDGDEPLQLIAHEARDIAAADIVTVVLPLPHSAHLMVEVVAARQPTELAGYQFPPESTLSGQAITSGLPVMIDDAAHQTAVSMHLSTALEVGPVMAVPLSTSNGVRGALVVGRVVGGQPFDAEDLDMATTFANHAAVALELADARNNEQRILLLEDRDRIARDLHDHVIQRLFAAGLSLDGLMGSVGSPADKRIGAVVDEIDETIRQIRTSIFELRGNLGPTIGSVRTELLGVIAEVRPLLPAEPQVSFVGPVDSVISDHVAEDLLAVLREALTNIARHADAESVQIKLSASTSQAELVIADNGVGLGTTTRRSGLANLRQRAELRGGSMTIDSPADPMSEKPGTRLHWTVPLP
jgi:two-component system, NarL family, sensor histidine kinase DevS